MTDDLAKLGLSLYSDFISVEEEIEILKYLAKPPSTKSKSRNSIQRFGSSKPYKSSMVSDKLPAHFNFILDRLEEKALVPKRPDSITANQYMAGQVITPHIDSANSGPVITILSLMSDATMVFHHKKEKYDILLKARSLVQLRDEIRNVWNHSIEPVKEQRFSIVFRCSL